MAAAFRRAVVDSQPTGGAFGCGEPTPAAPSLAVPRLGHVLSTVAETYGRPLRDSAEQIRQSIERNGARPGFAAHWARHYHRRGPRVGTCDSRDSHELAAWFLVSTWAVAVAANKLPPDSSIADAERWLLRDQEHLSLCQFISGNALEHASSLLQKSANPEALNDLLPYVLDPHGPGSRLSVRREPATKGARQKKRRDGVFYTPGDVATYMTEEALSELRGEAFPLTVLDPACGTGVFLRAALKHLIGRMPSVSALDVACHLYGFDVDEWVLDASAFVLLLECVASPTQGLAPIAAWRAIRMNFANLDALLVDPGRPFAEGDKNWNTRVTYRAALRAGTTLEPECTELPSGACRVDQVFPEMAEGPRVVLGNPPYAALGVERDLARLARTFSTFAAAPQPSSDIYPLFVEQMIRLAAPDSHGGALVLPLSIACNSGPQFSALRTLISHEPGTWRFAFFDREPHALFGEDVKTRNSIVLWTKHAADNGVSIQTGPLRKWRAQDRVTLLKRLDFTPIEADLRLGIPKIQGAEQADVLQKLLHEGATLRQAITCSGSASLSEALSGDARTIYVGPTAYNFINAFFRPPSLEEQRAGALSENHLHALVCPDSEIALSVFAALSGNLAFWWWHIHGDGFHVTRGTLESLPVGSALSSPVASRHLVRMGRLLWGKVSTRPKVSRNRGKLSLGFSAVEFPEQRREIDELLLTCAGIDAPFALALEECCQRVIRGQTQ
ncbi:MAG: N-6 DNA methylase [Burkholderiales bacterium]